MTSEKEQKKVACIGVDVGFGRTKGACLDELGELKTVSFSSVIGRAEEKAGVKVGLGSAARRQLMHLTYQEQEYFIGAGALLESRMAGGSRQDPSRIGSLEERLLMLAALAKMGVTEAKIVTGLPVFWFTRKNYGRLVRSWKGEHKIALNGRE